MSALNAPLHPEDLHPLLWRASQLARSVGRCIDTGYPILSNQLPGGGWPTGTLIDLLVQQCGSGEIRLVAPALQKVAQRRIAFLQPPHSPQIGGLAGLGLAPEHLLWVKSETSSDALWAAEQLVRGGCGAVLFWAKHVRPESLRRLHLAAQAANTLLFVLRPISAVQDSSPAPLRLSLRPASGGISIGIVKRNGPPRDEPIFLPLDGYGPLRSRPKALPERAPQVARPLTPVPSTASVE